MARDVDAEPLAVALIMGKRPALCGEPGGVCKISRSAVARVCIVLCPDELPMLCECCKLAAGISGDKEEEVPLVEKEREYLVKIGFGLEVAPAATAEEIKGLECVWDISVVGDCALGAGAKKEVNGRKPRGRLRAL